MPTYRIQNGDCRAEVQSLAACSVDSVVTDPPYELGFMGKAWDRSGIAYQVEVWRECLRVLKPGGHLLAFGGSRTYHRLACAIEDAGFEIRDQIQWLYGSGFPKSLNIGAVLDKVNGEPRERVPHPKKPQGPRGVCFAQDEWTQNMVGVLSPEATTSSGQEWNGWGTALKPAHEPIVLARKPLIGTVAENVLQHETGGLNIDGCRVELNGHSKTAGGCAGARPLHDGGIVNRTPEDNSLGRWPANVIHDGSEEVLTVFPDTDGQGGGVRGNEPSRSFGNVTSGPTDRQPFPNRGDTGNASRFFYCAKASKQDREDGCESLPLRSAGEVTDRQDGTDGLNSPRAGAGRTNGSRNHHPTVKPTDLMRYLCRLVTPPNGTVLDPFCGSGSTGRGAILEEFNFIGIELDAEYCELAEKRIAASIERRNAGTRQGSLFGT